MFGPQLSVIVTSFRNGELLRRALHNIRQQGIAELEILILDDGSVEIPQQLEGPVCFVRQLRRGIPAARNAGLRQALGEFVAFLDDDDQWPVGMLSRLTAKLLNSDDDIVLGRTQNVMPSQGDLPDSSFDSPAQTLVSMRIPAAVFRRSVFERVGEFNEALNLSADHEWLLRAREAGVAITIEAEVTLICRRHAASLAQLTAWPTLERRAPRQPRHLAVSVVIPVRNAERYLPDALASVAAQSLSASEVLVVDDGSTDLTTTIAESFHGPIRVLSQTHAGAAAARNLGVREAHSEWVAFLDADDFWLPDRLAWQAATLRVEPTLDILYGCVQQFYSPDLGWPETAAHGEAAAVQPGIFPGTCLLRKRAFEQVGEFDTTLQSGVFIDWHTRALDSGLRVKTIDEVLLRRRIHHADAAMRERQAHPEYVRNLKDALDRRRAVRPS